MGEEENIQLLKQAAAKGDARAQFDLAKHYEDGDGVEQNIDEAVKLYHKAAKGGEVDAAYNLGVMYYNGQGVEKDDRLAMKWYQKAAVQGDAEAQFQLGLINYDHNKLIRNRFSGARAPARLPVRVRTQTG